MDARFVESKGLVLPSGASGGTRTMGKGWFDEVDIADKRIRTMELIRSKCAASSSTKEC